MPLLLKLLLLLSCGVITGAPQETIVIVRGMSKTLSFPGLIRVAVARSTIASARAIPPNRVLVTGKKPGSTMVRVYSQGAKEKAFIIRVVDETVATTVSSLSPMVRTEVEFIELDRSSSDSMGIQWPKVLELTGSGILRGSLNQTGLNFEVSSRTAKGWIRALVTQGWARVVARPRLYGHLGEPLFFHAGGEFPFSAAFEENLGRRYQKVEWKKHGITVKATVDSLDFVRIHANLEVEVSEPISTIGVEGIPSLSKRHFKSRLSAKDGETLVVSGFERVTIHRHASGLPLFSKIPFLGYFFGTKKENASEGELLLAVTFSTVTRARNERRLQQARRRILGETP